MPNSSPSQRRAPRGVCIVEGQEKKVYKKFSDLFRNNITELARRISAKNSLADESIDAVRTQVRRFLNGENIDGKAARDICQALGLNPDEIISKPDFRSRSVATKKKPQKKEAERQISFSSYIKDKTDNFVGRQYVFDKFEAFQKKYQRGYFTLAGDPGEGKSAIAAELVKRNKGNRYFLYHFNRRKGGPNTAQQFLQNICPRLINLFRLDESIRSLENYEDGTYLQEIIDAASEQLQKQEKKLVIVIDALDEVALQDGQEESNILYLPEILPRNIYFFVTRRRDSKLRGRLSFGRDQAIFDFLDYDEKTEIGRKIIADIKIYISHYLNPKRYPEYADDIHKWLAKKKYTEQEFITKLTKRSQRNFMYLSYVLPECIVGGIYQDLDSMDSLPLGLNEYYWDHWQRMGMTGPERSDVEAVIIYLLTIVYSWVAITTIARYATITVGRNVSENEVVSYFERWRQFLHIEIIEDEDTFIIYHESFNDFLSEEKTVKATRIRINKIKENYGAALFGDLDVSDEEDDDEDD
ncbi:MAG: hypothetical protein AAF569_08815 [Pseudomonadota bacterium]